MPAPSYIPRHHPIISLTRPEKIAAIVALIVLLLGLFGYFYDRSQRKHEVPIQSGTYTEGVIADSPTKVERIVARLTNLGLTYRDNDNSIKPALAESWEVSNDNKTYTFRLRSGYDAAGLLATIQSSKTNWQGIDIAAPDGKTLVFRLQEPLSLFLATTTAAIFPFGPYKIVKRDDQGVVLRSNPEFVLGEPFIPKFVLRTFSTNAQLMKAAKEGEIQGTADFSETVPRAFQEYTVELPRYYILLFNTTRPVFKKVEDRQRVIAESDGPEVKYTLVTSQSGIASDLTDALAKAVASKHITLDVQKKNSLTLQKEEIQKRDFDLLLIGINYGVDRDYYPFWHSSQVASPGLNIGGVKDRDLDGLLETARREPDPVKRAALNGQIETSLTQKAYQKIVNQEKFEFWVNKRIRGVTYGTIEDGTNRFQLVWRWYIKSKKVK